MISDILSDAICDIEDYEKDGGAKYGEDTNALIAIVKAVMGGVMDILHAHPYHLTQCSVTQT